jgi:hypothetical protein
MIIPKRGGGDRSYIAGKTYILVQKEVQKGLKVKT